ncbi:Ig-like domain-containing protein [Frondihabitans sp. Leaf304]|uniref:Ig-like domain-containing protein n=1 Tax=Frondihabitans sp. Leaf304 TaxID=1736329 RepID=UPI0006F2C6E5|nr:Ig-like domain-containing protein [Frondihabitans sp. Leaf304]KQQ27617.1 hypothetical protein ASF54_02170 [Frondihabitans sp. Leaf304]
MPNAFTRAASRVTSRFTRLSPRRRTAIGTVAGVVVVATVVAAAIVSPGYERQDHHLDDGSVWVANGSDRLLGTANTEIGALTATVATDGSDMELLQDDTHVVVHDTGANTLQLVDPAQGTVTDTVPLPEGTPRVVGSGRWAAIYRASTGDAWASTLGDLSKFEATSAPTFSLGSSATLAVDADDGYAGYSAKTGTLVTGSLDPTSGRAASSRAVRFPGAAPSVQVTLVSGRPVLFDAVSGRLWVDGGFVDLTSGQATGTTGTGGATGIGDPGSARLQQPSTTGSRILLSDSTRLLAVDPGDRRVSVVGTGGRGTPAAPVRLDGCDYAAWSGGIALRQCGDGSTPTTETLDRATSAAPLALLVRGHHLVANDALSGRSWALQHGGQLIDNWSDFVDETKRKTTTESREDVPPKLDPAQKAPVARADSFGVRAGRANTLPVLLNDSDANGDALVVTRATALPTDFGRVDIVEDAQKILVTTRDDARGSRSFRYTISDGYGHEASARVTVEVHGDSVNGAPKQVRATRTSVAAGGTTRTSVLADWVDPDSDPIFLRSASTASPDSVNFLQDGLVTFTDSGSAAKAKGSLKSVALSVSDGTDQGAGSETVTVGARGSVPIIAESFSLTGYTGEQQSVAPLGNARGGTGTLRLDGVTAAKGDESVTLEPDFADGTFTVSASRAGTHHLRYSVTDGTKTASGSIRIDVIDPPSANLPPITVPTTAFLYLQDTKTVDPLATDSDPAGGVLSLVSVSGIPARSGVTVGIVQKGTLRVTLTRSLDGPVTFDYTVTNGKAEATGTVTVVETPEPDRLQPPQAVGDASVVRVGQVVDIPVLANDRQPNDKPLQLAPTLEQPVASNGGLLFAAQDRLRYLAPAKPGRFTAKYRITQSDGQYATASVSLTVKARDDADNRAPAPQTVTARVTAGGAVTIPIPLSGIDPEGDAVSLVGQASAPKLGAVASVGTDSITYRASSYASGTDTFEYSVVDAVGAVGTGTIRVGVTPSSGVVAPPIAQDDLVRTRPGTKLSVHVLDNDSAPSGGDVEVTGVEATSSAVRPSFTANSVALTAPEKAGSYGVLYSTRDSRGGSASAWLYLDVSKSAPLAGPVARDIVLKSSDIAGRSSVEVRPFRSVTFSEGSSADLDLSLLPGYSSGASVTGGVVTIAVAKSSRIVPFRVSRKDSAATSSIAFVWVPGTDDGRPELRPDAPALTVVSGSTLTIRLADQLQGVSGRAVRITGSSSVSATYSNGSSLVVDDRTLRFTSRTGYFGPASITLTATDAPAGRAASFFDQATLTIPITVTPKTDEPPVVNGADLPLEAGASTTVDLQALTDYPYPDRYGELRYSAVSGTPGAVTASVSGAKLSLRAVDGGTVGTTARVVVSVRDSKGAGKSGVVTVSIVRSTRPIVEPIPDSVTLRRGSSTSVSVLANDQATNPFPGHPLRVVSVGRGARLPAGVTVSPSADRSVVALRVAKTAKTGTVTVPYEVADVTNDPSRYASSTISLTIQDVPDAPAQAPAIAAKDTDKAQVTLRIPHAFPNYSPVRAYTVTSTDKSVTARCANPDACVVRGLAYGTPFAFTATADNALGTSKPSPASDTVVIDGTPGAPRDVSLTATAADAGGHSMLARWSAPQATKGTPVQSYSLVFSGPGVSLSKKLPATATSLALSDPRIQPGNEYAISITASNKTNTSQPASARSNSVGPPTDVAVSSATLYDGGIRVRVDWTPGSANGGQALVYSVTPVTGDTPDSCRPESMPGTNVGSATSWTDQDPGFGRSRYAVYASNGLFCARFTSGVADTNLPAAPSGEATLEKQTPGGTEVATDIRVGRLRDSSSRVDHYEYSLVTAGQPSGNWQRIDQDGGFITGVGTPNGNPYGQTFDVFARACRFQGSDTCGPETKIGQNLTPVAAVTPPPTTPPATPPPTAPAP